MTDFVVGVTALQAGWNPSPGVSVARSLHLAKSDGINLKLIGIDYDAFCTGLYLTKIFDESYLLPPISKPERLVEKLIRIHEKTGLNVIIPNLDVEQEVYSHLQPKLRELGIDMLVSSPKAIKMRSKITIADFARRYGFAVPTTGVLNSRNDLKTFKNNMTYPLVIKGHFCDAYPVRSFGEAAVYISKLEEIWGWPIVVQDYIDGEEYCVTAVSDPNSEVVGAVALKKFGMTDKGKVWAGATVAEPKLLDLTKDFISKLGWIGPIEIDFIRDTDSRQFYIIDVNPRFPSWVYLATAAGQNLPLLTVKLALGKRVDTLTNYETGLMFAQSVEDVILDVGAFTQFMAEEEESYEQYRRICT